MLHVSGQTVSLKHTYSAGPEVVNCWEKTRQSDQCSVATAKNNKVVDFYFPVYSLSRLLCHVGSGSSVARRLCSLNSNSQVQPSADENETTFIKCVPPA